MTGVSPVKAAVSAAHTYSQNRSRITSIFMRTSEPAGCTHDPARQPPFMGLAKPSSVGKLLRADRRALLPGNAFPGPLRHHARPRDNAAELYSGKPQNVRP